MRPPRLDHDAHSRIEIRLVAHLYRHAEADPRIGVGLVLHHRADQRFVGNDCLDPRQRAQHGIARGDPRHLALVLIDRDDIADADRAVEQNDEAGNVTGGDLLQAEADAHAQRAAEHRQRRQVDAHQRQADQHRQHDQKRLRQAGEHQAEIAVDRFRLQQACFHQAADPQGQQQRDQHGSHALQQQPEREPLLAHGESDRFQHVDQLWQQPKDMQGNDAPHHQREHALERGQPAGRRKSLAQREHHGANDREGNQQRHCHAEKVHVVPLPEHDPGQQHQAERNQGKQQAVQPTLADAPRALRRARIAPQCARRQPGQPQANGQRGDLPEHFGLLQVAPERIEQVADFVLFHVSWPIAPLRKAAPRRDDVSSCRDRRATPADCRAGSPRSQHCASVQSR